MNDYEEIYKNICRVCLSINSDKVSLLDNNSEDELSCYGKAMLSFANISIKKQNNMPSTMCSQCLKLLKQAIRFKFNCENSEKQLLKWMDFVERSNSEVKKEEYIVQNIMFKKFFPEEINTSTYDKNIQQEISKIIYENDSDKDEFNMENNIEVKSSNMISNTDDCDKILNIMENQLLKYSKMPMINSKINKTKRLQYKTRMQTKKQINKAFLAQSSLYYKRLEKRNLQNTQNTKKTFICNICNKELANPITFRHHMQRHNGCNFICECCGKGFATLAELQLHQLARHDIGPHLKCKHCNYKAPRPYKLIEHERLHTGERPYSCDKCGLTFRRKAILRKHTIYHMEKTVQCLHCPRKFYRQSEMEAHSNSVHERRYAYQCHKCETVYAKPGTVRRHLIERHGIPREMQGRITRINKGKCVNLLEQ